MTSLRSEIEASFAPELLSQSTRTSFQEKYSTSTPYKHAVVDALINDDLLRKAREEIIEELRFTEKETDIYKVNQTGDLANLDGLPEREAERLKNLLKVRDAIYSPEFRKWLQDVTGCGPLSEKKKDMSINDYRHGCHLLNHDDVIATRRVSYILYLPDPDQPWQPEWGGALELYPVKTTGKTDDGVVSREPENTPSVSIPPRWNQYNFFAVQPGHSFHSVEEVAHPTASRLSISGWFHRPQPDEVGFDKEDESREERERKEHASAEGLSSKRAAASFIPYPEDVEPPLPGSQMTQADVNFLRPFLNPAYLAPRTQAQLFEKFGDESHVLLSDIFNSKVATALEKGLKGRDDKDGFRWWKKGKGEQGYSIASHQAGVDDDWKIVGPPHRQRYLSLRSDKPADGVLPTNPSVPSALPFDSPADLLDIIRSKVLPSPAFRHFLANITQLVPISHRPFEARRFRPGLDYTLARSDEEVVLDVCFGLTPDMERVAMDAAGGGSGSGGPRGLSSNKLKKPKTTSTSPRSQLTKKQARELSSKWESGEIGGWSCYMAPDEEDENATGEVYRQGNGKKQSSKKEAELQAAAAIAAQERFEAEERSKGTGAGVQRRNLKDFDYSYVTLSFSGQPTLSQEQLHSAITSSLQSLHGDVNGSFKVDILSIKDAEALLRVSSDQLSKLTSAISAALTIEGYRFEIKSQGNAFSISDADGSKWLDALDPPSGKRVDSSTEDDDEQVNDQGDAEDEDEEDDDEEDSEEEEEEDFDGVLLNLTPSFNTLSVALRDEGVLHFVKYLGCAAGGSRWDLVAEFGVGAVEADDDDMEE